MIAQPFDLVFDLLRDILLEIIRPRLPFIAEHEARLDGIVAHLYGLTEDEFNTILTEVGAPDPIRVGAANAYRDVERGLIK